jgi:hypothetical protein
VFQGATNNKRLFTGTGVIAFKGRRDMEVLVMGDWSDWTVRGGGARGGGRSTP